MFKVMTWQNVEKFKGCQYLCSQLYVVNNVKFWCWFEVNLTIFQSYCMAKNGICVTTVGNAVLYLCLGAAECGG